MAERKFYNGIKGKTNVIEGMIINDNRGQLVNYVMLYDSGDECTDITGGWGDTGYSTANAWTLGTKNSDHLSMTSVASSGVRTEFFGANNLITCDGETKYALVCKTTSNQVERAVLLIANKKTSPASSANYHKYDSFTNTTKQCVVKEIGASSFYPVFYSDGNNNVFSVYNFALLKADDWSTLAEKANITATSINDILAKSSTLLANSDAVNFMCKQCTGDFMASAVASDSFLTALESSPYKNKVYANQHWAKFLAMVA